MTRYFRVHAGQNAVDRWFLRSPINTFGEELDPRTFTRSQVCSVTDCLTLPLRRSGSLVDFNFADFDMPVLSVEIIDKLQNVPGVRLQRIPVSIPETEAKFDILNVLDSVDCIDEVNSVYTRWEANDGRPGKIGQYRMIVDLKIDPGRADGHHLFRLEGWEVALIVSAQVKQVLESLNVSGIEYQFVC